MGIVKKVMDIKAIPVKNSQIKTFGRELFPKNNFYGIQGVSAPMKRVFDMIANAAQSESPVIIFGETGTGKNLISKTIHNVSKRRLKPFVKVKCAAQNEVLMESELFGHVKGAFAGACQNQEGKFKAAQGGVIFLDEVGDLPFSTQIKLLQVLKEKVFMQVGDNNLIHVDVRIISANRRNLMNLVKQGTFNEDLFNRINVIPITVPPLRGREEDIPILAEFFFSRFQLNYGKKIEGISNDAMKTLMSYSWPGNARELKNAFEYAFVTCHEKLIQPYHLPPTIFKKKGLQNHGENPEI